jgi:hypothetical protein
MPVRRADDDFYELLVNGAATGNAVPIKGGEYLFQVNGTAGGAAIALQMQTRGGVWLEVNIYGHNTQHLLTFTPATTVTLSVTPIPLPACNVRFSITGGTPSGLTAALIGLG